MHFCEAREQPSVSPGSCLLATSYAETLAKLGKLTRADEQVVRENLATAS